MNQNEILTRMAELADQLTATNDPAEAERIKTEFEFYDSQWDDAPPDPLWTLQGHGIHHYQSVPWWDAPIPRRWHRCKAQSWSLLASGFWERCACGAARIDHRVWIDRNTRTKEN